ncbi:60S ribosomal protein L34 [Tanacetum coccineum]
MYKEGDASTLRDIEFEGVALTGLLKKLKGACQFPIKAFKNEKLIEIYLEHHGYDLSHWVQTEIEDDEVSVVGEMEDITPYDSDDEGVDTRYKVVHDVLYPEFDPSLPWNEMKQILGLRRNDAYQNLMVLCGRDIAEEGRCGGPGKKGKIGVQSPGKKAKIGVQSPGKKGKIGVQSPGKKGKKGVQSPGKKGKKGVQSPGKKGKGVESTDKKGKCIGKKGVQKGCTFRLWASWMQDGSCFQIKTLISQTLMLLESLDLGSLVVENSEAEMDVFERHQSKVSFFEARIYYSTSVLCKDESHWVTLIEKAKTVAGLPEHEYLASNLADTITPSIRKQIEHLKITQRYWTVCPCGDNNYEVRKGDESFGVNIEKRICSCNWWTLSGVPCVHTVAAYCFLKTDPALGVSPCYVANLLEEDLLATVQEGCQTSKTSMKEVVEASIAAGTLKLAGVKRRSKSERIANKAKAFKFGKDGAGSSADKAWGVDEVLAEDVVF